MYAMEIFIWNQMSIEIVVYRTEMIEMLAKNNTK